nr:putative retrotransposon Ty1-copia subclass protein [Tanacetum cinerariifolium]
MNLTSLPLSFSDYALETTTRILNMVLTKKVDKTLYELCKRDKELKEIQDEDTSPSENTSKIPMETIGSKWLFKKKTDMDGNVHTYKARLEANSFTQTYGVDYEETFSPVADIRAIRILIAIAVFYDYEIWKMDAFLNGYLDEDIYMTCYISILNGGVVDWKVSKQSTTIMSATEAKYIVASEAEMETVWIRKFISGL